MAVLNRTKCRVIENNIYNFEGVFIVNNTALWSSNFFGKNDVALENIIKMYPEFKELILEEYDQNRQ